MRTGEPGRRPLELAKAALSSKRLRNGTSLVCAKYRAMASRTRQMAPATSGLGPRSLTRLMRPLRSAGPRSATSGEARRSSRGPSWQSRPRLGDARVRLAGRHVVGAAADALAVDDLAVVRPLVAGRARRDRADDVREAPGLPGGGVRVGQRAGEAALADLAVGLARRVDRVGIGLAVEVLGGRAALAGLDVL